MQSLVEHDLHVERSWLDPMGPRDATILYTPASGSPHELHALVWDEETGWRTGGYASGEQGVRTRLHDTDYLGGGVLTDPRELAVRLMGETRAPRTAHRSHTALRDGLDDALRDLGQAR
ncbi:DUF6292 family protein [Actinomadura alba]|uniref:DUF6292 domain-containing protein n=1 Tax=Actinomadura alba TaxID=406431 RepID=A0ABR7LVS5_9ACTN|nr:DUF6292 family protein [Actinomadura alba]MBC6468523.1 hypothetical protein [Actinomadura alba]